MQNRKAWIRFFVGSLAVVLLLLPPLLTAVVWTTVNLYITAFAIVLTLVVAAYLPKLKWIFAIITAASVGLPAYPNWLYWDEKDGWFFWLGPSLRNWEFGANVMLFAIALVPFIALFWAIGSRERRGTADTSAPH